MKNCVVRTIILGLLLCFGMGARADNTVTLTGGNGTPGEKVTVTVSLANSDAVSALQLSIPLGENLEYVAESVTATARLENLTVSAGVKDGALNIMVYSITMATISAGEGDILSFQLKLGDVPTDISLTPSTLTLTGANGSAVSSSAIPGTVSIRCPKAQYSTMTVDFGEVPIMSTYHQTVTVTNVGNEPLTVFALTFSDPQVFSSTTTLPFVVAAGSSRQIDVTYAPTERGTTQKTMQVMCNSVSKLNTIKLEAQPFAVNELHVGNASGVSDTEVEVALTMNNMDPIIGFQVEFLLPSALEYVAGSFTLNSSRKDDHVAGVVTQDNLLRIIAYSPTGKALTGDDGVIGTFRLRLVGRNGVTLTPSNAILTAQIAGVTTNVLSAQYGGTISIQSPRLNSNSTLAFGRMPVTDDVEQTYTINNYGSAPLTVSKVVFLDEGYEVTETLPIEVGTYQNVTLTVVRTNMTEGNFATTMQVYSNDPELRMQTVAVSGNIFAPNYLTVTVDDCYQGSGVKMHVATDNYDAINGIQFDVRTTDDFDASSAVATASARAANLSVTTHRVDDETLRVVAYLMGGSIDQGSGEVFTLSLTPTEQLAVGSHNMTIENITLGTSGLQNKYAGEATLPVDYSVAAPVVGDANGDGDVDVNDITAVVNYIQGNPQPSFNAEAADVNNDGEIDVNDITSIVNIIQQ